MKKISELDVIRAVGFDLQESVKDLFTILENLYKEIQEVKTVLEEKN